MAYKKHLLSLCTTLLSVACLSLAGCNNNEPKQIDDGGNVPVQPEEGIEEARATYISALENYVDPIFYREAEQKLIAEYIQKGKDEINKATTKSQVSQIALHYCELIDSLKTDEDYQKEEVPSYDNCTSTQQMRDYLKQGYSPLYLDSNWRAPISCTKPYQNKEEGFYHTELFDFYKKPDVESVWQIAQWGSHYDLIVNKDPEKDGHTISEDETGLIHTITSKGKMINNRFVPAKKLEFNTITGGLYMECNCSVEYEQPRQSNEPWTHLLIQDNYPASEKYHLASSSSIIAESQFRIDKFVDHMAGSANPGIHAAQVVWYLKIRNLNQESEGYGQSIWFGIPIWDNRNQGKTYPEYCAFDAGTGTIIISPSSADVYESNKGITPLPGQSAKISLEIVEILQTAFIKARQEGYFTKSTWTDLYIDHTNFGFEMPGTYDIGVQFDSINVFVKQ